MLVVGLNSSGYVSSAAIVLDGELVFGCAEERLDRRKLSKYFPHRSIQAGLKHIGATMADVDQFAIGYNPGISVASRTRSGFSEWPGWPGARLYSNPNQLLPHLGGDGNMIETEQIFRRKDESPTRLRYVTHHIAHAANAFLLSGFTEAAILCCDGYGERSTTTWARADKDGIHPLKEITYPHSIGGLYAAVTQFLGFQPDSDEWKVMGAAALGNADTVFEKLCQLIRWDDDASFELDLSFFNFFDFDVSPMYRPKLEALLGPARNATEHMSQRHFDIAAGLQKLVETYLHSAITWLHRQTGSTNLCLTGGVAMNSVFNGQASLKGPFVSVYVPFAPDDNGNSIGAALWVAWREGDLKNFGTYRNFSRIGRAYSADEIEMDLNRFGLKYRKMPDICEAVADLLVEGKTVGWFQGRMEFGHRALGARSILADPRHAGMKGTINAAVKYRESFRPFAPAILAEAVTEYFEVDREFAVRYMEKVLPIRPMMQCRIPAVVHADGSGRLQTVNSEDDPLFHRLITAFSRRAGVPVVLNTSFNVNGEPIVESPADALRTFFTSGLDAVALGPFLLEKAKM